MNTVILMVDHYRRLKKARNEGIIIGMAIMFVAGCLWIGLQKDAADAQMRETYIERHILSRAPENKARVREALGALEAEKAELRAELEKRGKK